jgi:uncharacterized protein (TIGR00369 family)
MDELEMRRRVTASFELQGLMHHLGARLTSIEPGCVHIELTSRPAVTQQHGYIHAGATTAIADSAGGYAALSVFPADTDVLTVEYKLNLLAPARDRIEAIGTVLKSGRTLTVCRLEVFATHDDHRQLVAAGQQTLIRIPARDAG